MRTKLSCRNRSLLNVSLWGFDDNGAADAHESPGYGNNPAGFLGIQMEYGGYVIWIGELFDGSPGRCHLHCRRHSQRNTIDVFDFVDDGDRAEQAIVNEHAVVIPDNRTDNLFPCTHEFIDAGRRFTEIHRSRHDDDPFLIGGSRRQTIESDGRSHSQTLAAREWRGCARSWPIP